MRSWPRVVLAIAAIGAGLYGLTVAAVGDMDPGLVTNDPGIAVREVTPGSFAWETGLRPGQAIVWQRLGDEPGGMAIQTREANGGEVILFGPVDLFLRGSTLFAVAALVLGVLALPIARFAARRAELLATFGLGLAVVPIAIAFDLTSAGALVVSAAALAPWLWFARWGPVDRRVALAGIGLGAALSMTWILLRSVAPMDAPLARNGLGAWIVVSMLLLLAVGARMTPRRAFGARSTIGLLDVVVAVVAVALALVLQDAGVHVVLAAAVVALPLVAYLAGRRRVTEGLNLVLLADLREREAIRATEEERARVSREIHDDPLQQLAGVIRGLEADGDTEAATASLRDVAARLRVVATELHPPVLDDLGLVPAIEQAARTSASGGSDGPPISVEIANDAGYASPARPPADVELAVFRIVQEAMTNAIRHSGASAIAVAGRVAPHDIELSVTDDGSGLPDDAIETALRAGHIGLASMRQRAAAINAALTFKAGGDGGTTVHLRWHR